MASFPEATQVYKRTGQKLHSLDKRLDAGYQGRFQLMSIQPIKEKAKGHSDGDDLKTGIIE